MGEMEGQMGWDRKFENNDELKGREEGKGVGERVEGKYKRGRREVEDKRKRYRTWQGKKGRKRSIKRYI
jgi:hypothetical protein